MGSYMSNHDARVARARAEQEAYYAAHPEMRMSHVAPMDINRLMLWNYMPGGMYYGASGQQPAPAAPAIGARNPALPDPIWPGDRNYRAPQPGVVRHRVRGGSVAPPWGDATLASPPPSAAPTVAPPSAAAPQVAPSAPAAAPQAAPRSPGVRSALAAAAPAPAGAAPENDLPPLTPEFAQAYDAVYGKGASGFSPAPSVGTPGAGVPAITDAASKAPMDGLVQKKNEDSGMSPFLGGGVMDVMAKKGMNPYQGLFGLIANNMFEKGGLFGGLFNA